MYEKDWSWEELVYNTWESEAPCEDEEVDFFTEDDPLADLMGWEIP